MIDTKPFAARNIWLAYQLGAASYIGKANLLREILRSRLGLDR